ncbi:MAG: serine hydrolase domain-containing protein [Gaiellales bacterium]
MSLDQTFHQLLAAAQAERVPSLSASVFREGEVVWREAIGLADVERDERATTAHRYRVGSITKTFTAVAVMQLREEGRLMLDQPLRDVVPELPPGPTFAQALAHLTGIQREPAGEIWETMVAPDREALLAGLEDAERVLEPGEAWHYSNLAFAVLGEAIERLSGSYETHMTERILEPLALADTSLRRAGTSATPYFVHPWTQVAHVEPSFDVDGPTAAAGWLWSTPTDLARWADFLCIGADGVLRRGALDEMATLRTMVDTRAWTRGWGLGLELARVDDRVVVGHGGAMPGFLAGVYVERAQRVGAAVVANTGAAFSPKELAFALLRAALIEPAAPPEWRPAPPPPAGIEPLLGVWWTEGDEALVTWEAPRLRIDLRHTPDTASWLSPAGEDAWRVVEGRELGERLTVVRDERSEVVKLYLATYPLTRAPTPFAAADESRSS